MHEATHKPFLTAKWKYLAMLNFEVDPSLIELHLPAGTQIDFFAGKTFLSLVGFMFHDTKVRGCRIPGHVNFPEVNLRYYVCREVDGQLRRGVGFIKEICPRHAITFVARQIYHENYVTYPMRHEIANSGPQANASYRWRTAGRWHQLTAGGHGELVPVSSNDEAQFITEHYWGYSSQPDGSTLEYQVEHPSWNFWPANSGEFSIDIGAVYGEEFVEPLSARPSSAFLVDGSEVSVYPGTRL